jgi:hypothetical protein
MHTDKLSAAEPQPNKSNYFFRSDAADAENGKTFLNMDKQDGQDKEVKSCSSCLSMFYLFLVVRCVRRVTAREIFLLKKQEIDGEEYEIHENFQRCFRVFRAFRG